MRKFGLWLISVALLVSSFPAGAQSVNCLTSATRLLPPYKGQIGELPINEYHRKMNRRDWYAKVFRKLKKGEMPAVVRRVGQYVSEIDNHLMKGETDIVYRKLSRRFREYELAAIHARYFKQAKEALEGASENISRGALKKRLTKKDIPPWISHQILTVYDNNNQSFSYLERQMQKWLNDNMVMIGSYYENYAKLRNLFHDYFEGGTCDKDCQRVKELYARLGISAEEEKGHLKTMTDVTEGIDDITRPSMEEIETLMYHNRLATLAQKNREVAAEFVDAFSTFFKFITGQRLAKFFYKFFKDVGTRLRNRLVRLFKGIYNAEAREEFFPAINSLARSAESIDQKFGQFIDILRDFKDDEFLVTFSRRSDFRAAETWKALKERAKEQNPELYQRLLRAESQGEVLGEISLEAEDNIMGKMALVIAAGGGAFLAYKYVDFDRVSSFEVFDDNSQGDSSDSSGEDSDESEDDLDGGTIRRREVTLNMRDEDLEALQEQMIEFVRANKDLFNKQRKKPIEYEDVTFPENMQGRVPAQTYEKEEWIVFPWLRNWFLEWNFRIRAYYRDWTSHP